jgi:TolB protein
MSVSLSKKRTIASNFDGLNISPAFSKDGTKVVYCASRGNGSCQLYYFGKGEFKRLTHNDGNNVSPTLSADGSKIFFCSDFKSGKPQIFCHDMVSNAIDQITESGSCYCPSYCTQKGKVAYCKLVSGIMQIFVYDEKAKTHTQLTFDAASKDECSWSPDGSYLLFGMEDKGINRIASLNVATLERHYITPAQSSCSYPSWSPAYALYPVVTG